MNKTKTAKNLIALSVAVTLVALFGGVNKAYAEHCESNYGGGENCIYNKRFEIDKDVRIEGDSEWLEDKVTGVKKGDTVEFRIKIKNLSDEGTGSFDNMKMEDSLPDELIREGGSGLTEYWNDFDAGETKTFIMRVKIDSDEFDRNDNFEKCVVNRAEVRWDKKFEGSDSAAVCYGNGEPRELPKTGAESGLAVVGLALLASGVLVKLTKRVAKVTVK
jgi:LPXTG-motif cell wall-anchored protein